MTRLLQYLARVPAGARLPWLARWALNLLALPGALLLIVAVLVVVLALILLLPVALVGLLWLHLQEPEAGDQPVSLVAPGGAGVSFPSDAGAPADKTVTYLLSHPGPGRDQ